MSNRSLQLQTKAKTKRTQIDSKAQLTKTESITTIVDKSQFTYLTQSDINATKQ